MRQIGGFLGRSAFGPLAEQMLKARETVEELPGLLRAFAAGQRQVALEVAARIDTLEGQTDDVKDEIRTNLSRSFFSSVERSEVLLLVKLLDSIADDCQRLAKSIAIRDTPFPSLLNKPVEALVAQVIKAVEALTRSVLLLRHSEARSAPRSELARAEETLRQVAYEEYLADQAEHDALKTLFDNEKGQDAVSVIFLMQIIRQIGAVADAAQNSADGFRRLIGSH